MDAADTKAASLIALGILQLTDDLNNLMLFRGVADVTRATELLDSPKQAHHMLGNTGVVGFSKRHIWKACLSYCPSRLGI
jgi:hypothetical protein